MRWLCERLKLGRGLPRLSLRLLAWGLPRLSLTPLMLAWGLPGLSVMPLLLLLLLAWGLPGLSLTLLLLAWGLHGLSVMPLRLLLLLLTWGLPGLSVTPLRLPLSSSPVLRGLVTGGAEDVEGGEAGVCRLAPRSEAPSPLAPCSTAALPARAGGCLGC